MATGNYFLAGVGTAPIIIPNSGIQKPGIRSSRATGSKSSKKEKDDIDALKGQTYALSNEESKISLTKMAMTQQLIGLLKNDHNGDMASFMRDPAVNTIVRSLHKIDNLHKYNIVGAKEEKRKYEEGITNAKNNDAIGNYATDSRGRRLYYDENGELQREDKNSTMMLYSKGGDYLKVDELYNGQRKSLGINKNGMIEEGIWADTFDNKARYFDTEARDYIDKAKSGYIDTKTGASLGPSPYTSFLKFYKSRTKDNYNNLIEAAQEMRGKLSPEAIKDAQQQYWELGLDKTIGLQLEFGSGKNKKVETKKYSPEDFKRIFLDEDYTREEAKYYKAYKTQGELKTVMSENDKFNEFIVIKAMSKVAGNRQYTFDNLDDYKKLTESEAGAYFDRKKATAYEVATNEKYVQKAGVTNPETIFVDVKYKDQDGRGIKQKVRIENSSYLTLESNVFNGFTDLNEKIRNYIFDSDNEIIEDKAKQFTLGKMGYREFVFNGNIIPYDLSKNAYFISYDNTITLFPEIKGGKWRVGDKTFDDNKLESYQKVTIAIPKGMEEEFSKHIAMEGNHEDLTAFDRNNLGDGLFYKSYTELNDATMGTDANKLIGEKGGEYNVDGYFEGDMIYLEGYVKVPNTAVLNKQSSNATTYNRAVETRTNNAEAINEKKNEEEIYAILKYK